MCNRTTSDCLIKVYQCGMVYMSANLTCVLGFLTDDREGAAVKRRGRPRKRQETERKRLFDEQSGSDEDESISGGSDREDKREEVDEDAPLIETIRSAARRRAQRGERADKRERSKEH